MQPRIVRVLGFVCVLASGVSGAQTSLPTPGFHHLHLNSTDPEAAIAFYEQQFPFTSRTTWSDIPALASPNNVLILFDRVAAPPPADPEASAFWHFGWHVTDVRRNLERYSRSPEVTLAPLYVGDRDATVYISSDTWPGTAGSNGRTRAQIEDAKAQGLQPRGGGGFAYLYGPDNALVEYVGDMPADRFNHVHLYQDDPFCAQIWYRRHLNAPLTNGAVPRAQAECGISARPQRSWPALLRNGMFRTPQAGVLFGDVSVRWYVRQTDASLRPTRGRLMDHIALGVTDLDAWIAKLVSEGIEFLESEYRIGNTRAIMIAGPSREAIEIVEITD